MRDNCYLKDDDGTITSEKFLDDKTYTAWRSSKLGSLRRSLTRFQHRFHSQGDAADRGGWPELPSDYSFDNFIHDAGGELPQWSNNLFNLQFTLPSSPSSKSDRNTTATIMPRGSRSKRSGLGGTPGTPRQPQLGKLARSPLALRVPLVQLVA